MTQYFLRFFIFATTLIHTLPAWAQNQGSKPSATQGFGMFLPLILIFGIFYFLIIRPQQKQAKQRQAMIASVQRGQDVILTSGIHARIVGVADNILTVEIADNCKVKMDRSGIQSVKGMEEPGKKKP